MVSTALGAAIALNNQISGKLKDFINTHYSEQKAAEILAQIESLQGDQKKIILPATSLNPKDFVDQLMSGEIFEIQK